MKFGNQFVAVVNLQYLNCIWGPYSWLVNKVGLQPTDSTTYILDCEDREYSSDNNGDEYIVDKSDSVFQAQMHHWVAGLQPGLDPLKEDITKMVQLETMEKESNMDAGLPTVVGSDLASVSNIH